MLIPHSSASGSSSSQSICIWWLRGSCKYGDSCMRLHGKDINKTSYQRGYDGSDGAYQRPSAFPLSPVASKARGNWRSKIHEGRNTGRNTNGESDTPVYTFPGSPTRPICRYWKAGNCTKAEECQFRHDPELSQVANSVAPFQNLTSEPGIMKEEADEATGGGNWRLRAARQHDAGHETNQGLNQGFDPETFPSTQTPVCSYWEAGDCARGEHCRFLHDPTITTTDVFQVATSHQLEMALEKANQDHKRSLEQEKAAHQAREAAAQEIQDQEELFLTTLNSIEQHYMERRAQFEAGDYEAWEVAERRQHSIEKGNGQYKLWLTQETIDYDRRVAEARENHALALEGAHKEYKRRLAKEATAVEASKIAAREHQRQLQALRNEEAEITEKYAVLGDSSLITCRAGIDVQNVVIGFDICRIIIKNLPRDTKHKEISDILVHYGMDSSDFFILDFRFRRNCREVTVLVITNHGHEIAVGLEDTEFRDHTLTFEVSESPNGNAMGSSPRNVLSICWRVPHTTIIATYKTMTEAERKARALNGKVCKGQRIRAEQNKLRTPSIKLTGFPLGTSEDQVIRTFAGTTNIKSMSSNSCTFEESFAMLLDHLRTFPNVETKSHKLISVSGRVRVKAYFDSRKDAERAHVSLDGKQLVSNSPIFHTSLPSALQYKTIVALQQYEAQKRKWDALSENMTGSDALVQISIVEDRNTVLISVFGQDKKAVGSLKVKVEGMAAGERLDSHFWHPSFLTPDGKAFFDHIYKDKKVYVRSDLKFRALRLYGETKAVEETRQMIQEEINRLARLETTVALDQKSIGFFMRQGLGRLQELLGEENVVLNFVPGKCEITIKGGEEERHHLNRLIRESQAQTMEQIHSEKDEKATCPICYDEVSHPEQLGCGHIYCSGCLRHYLASAPETKTFPLVCLGDETACKMPISLPLIRRFMTPQAFRALVEAAFRSYLDQHSQELKFCTTPDCQQIYRHSPEKRTLQCPSCFSSICSACDDEAHEGLTCKERRDQKNSSEQDRLFNEWADEHCKRCPECKSVIEKIDGCNRITCRCGAHFCWKCGETFKLDEIYNHLNNAHGGYFD